MHRYHQLAEDPSSKTDGSLELMYKLLAMAEVARVIANQFCEAALPLNADFLCSVIYQNIKTSASTSEGPRPPPLRS